MYDDILFYSKLYSLILFSQFCIKSIIILTKAIILTEYENKNHLYLIWQIDLFLRKNLWQSPRSYLYIALIMKGQVASSNYFSKRIEFIYLPMFVAQLRQLLHPSWRIEDNFIFEDTRENVSIGKKLITIGKLLTAIRTVNSDSQY